MTYDMGGGLAWPVKGTLRAAASGDIMATASSAPALVAPGTARLIPVDCRTTDGRQLLDVELRTDPGTWRPAVLDGGRTCLLTDGLNRGRYTVQARHGRVVLDAGLLTVNE